MVDLKELYQEIILDHGKRPRNRRTIDHADRRAEGFNPLCGDKVNVAIRVDDQVISDIAFTGDGCAICMASASLMTEELKGRTLEEADELFERFRRTLTNGDGSGRAEEISRLSALAGVKRFPMRVKCATLPWHTMRAAIADRDEVISTE